MAIKNFSPAQATDLIKALVKAWPWDATRNGHAWWVEFCTRLDAQADVSEAIEIQPIEHVGYDVASLERASDLLSKLREATNDGFEGVFQAWDMLIGTGWKNRCRTG